jgi:hypothetical protein
MKNFVAVIIVFICLAAGIVCFILFRSSSPVVWLEGEILTKRDIDYKIKVEQCYGAKWSYEQSLINLIDSFLQQAVLKKMFNLEPSLVDLMDSAKNIDKNTKAPEILKCVKRVFGNKTNYYLRLYVRPVLINYKLHQTFSFSEKIHQQEIAKIEQIRQEINEGKDLREFKEYKQFEVDKQKDIPDLLKEADIQFSEDYLVVEVLQKMSKGEIWPNIIADDYTYQIIRLLNEDEGKYYCDGVMVNKKSFDSWFRDYVGQNIKIEIKDKDIEKKIKQDYPQLWWVDLIL